jgi:hypothetical protein
MWWWSWAVVVVADFGGSEKNDNKKTSGSGQLRLQGGSLRDKTSRGKSE